MAFELGIHIWFGSFSYARVVYKVDLCLFSRVPRFSRDEEVALQVLFAPQDGEENWNAEHYKDFSWVKLNSYESSAF